MVTAALGPSPYPARPSHKLTIKDFPFSHPHLYCEAPNPTVAEAHVAFALLPAHAAGQRYRTQEGALPRSRGRAEQFEGSPEAPGLLFVAAAPGENTAHGRCWAQCTTHPLLPQDQISTVLNLKILH